MFNIGDPGPGVARAWEVLAARRPEAVCAGAGVFYDREKGSYTVESFGCEFHVDPWRRTLAPLHPEGLALTDRLAYFFLHSLIWYLGHAEDFPETGRWVKPEGIKGGANFFTGAHALPLPEIAKRYNAHRGDLLSRGRNLAGIRSGYGDESVTLKPLPRVSAALLLWYGDDEFEPRADLLLDSSVEIRFPLDVIWSVAMMTSLVFL